MSLKAATIKEEMSRKLTATILIMNYLFESTKNDQDYLIETLSFVRICCFSVFYMVAN